MTLTFPQISTLASDKVKYTYFNVYVFTTIYVVLKVKSWVIVVLFKTNGPVWDIVELLYEAMDCTVKGNKNEYYWDIHEGCNKTRLTNLTQK